MYDGFRSQSDEKTQTERMQELKPNDISFNN